MLNCLHQFVCVWVCVLFLRFSSLCIVCCTANFCISFFPYNQNNNNNNKTNRPTNQKKTTKIDLAWQIHFTYIYLFIHRCYIELVWQQSLNHFVWLDVCCLLLSSFVCFVWLCNSMYEIYNFLLQCARVCACPSECISIVIGKRKNKQRIWCKMEKKKFGTTNTENLPRSCVYKVRIY